MRYNPNGTKDHGELTHDDMYHLDLWPGDTFTYASIRFRVRPDGCWEAVIRKPEGNN